MLPLARTFVEKLTLVQQAQHGRIPLQTLKKRHERSLGALFAQPWRAPLPEGTLILLIDGLWFTIEGNRWVVYIMALRSVYGIEAVFLRPILRPGYESQNWWQEVIQTIPEEAKKRIRALVSDSFRGVKGLASGHGWILQRCQAHLLRRVADVFGSRKLTLAWKRGRTQAEKFIRSLLRVRHPQSVRRVLRSLSLLAGDPSCPVKVRMIIREAVRYQKDFRAHLLHPELRLPATTNAIESKNSCLRELARRSRGFRTPQSLERWITAAVRFRSTSICRSKTPQN